MPQPDDHAAEKHITRSVMTTLKRGDPAERRHSIGSRLALWRIVEKEPPRTSVIRPGLPVGRSGAVRVEDSGDNRLSRQGHYHGPDGLNGRVRNGNGCDPAGMVAGKAPGGRSGRAGGRCQSGGQITQIRTFERVVVASVVRPLEWTPTAAGSLARGVLRWG